MDSFWDKVKKGAKETGEKAAILAKIGKLQAEIAGINSSKSGKFAELGKATYAMFKDGKLPEELKAELTKLISPIEEAEKSIEDKEKEIAELRKQMQEVKKEVEEAKPAEQPKEETALEKKEEETSQ